MIPRPESWFRQFEMLTPDGQLRRVKGYLCELRKSPEAEAVPHNVNDRGWVMYDPDVVFAHLKERGIEYELLEDGGTLSNAVPVLKTARRLRRRVKELETKLYNMEYEVQLWKHRADVRRSLLSEADIVGRAERVEKYTKAGVYFLIHEGHVVYVGQSCSVFARLSSHLSDNGWQGRKPVDHFYYLEVEGDEDDRRALESRYIALLAPPLNGQGAVRVDDRWIAEERG